MFTLRLTEAQLQDLKAAVQDAIDLATLVTQDVVDLETYGDDPDEAREAYEKLAELLETTK